MRHYAFIAAAIFIVAPASAQRDRQPEVSAEALKAMQTHEFNASSGQVFGAVVSALTDKNYSVDSANKDAGLITATENTTSKMSGLGMATRQNTIKLSIIITSISDTSTKVRINAIDNYVYTYHGKKYRDENTTVSIAKIYDDFFVAIDGALS
jgi:hypothetical protein